MNLSHIQLSICEYYKDQVFELQWETPWETHYGAHSIGDRCPPVPLNWILTQTLAY